MWSARDQVHLGELQPGAHGEKWQREGARRAGPHRPGQLAVRLVQVALVHGEPGGADEPEQARHVVVHPVLIDGGERRLHMLGRLQPAVVVHGQHRELGLAQDEHVGVAVDGRHGRRLGEQGLGAIDVAGEQMRLRATRRAPGRARRSMAAPPSSGKARIGHRLLGAGGTHERAQHRPGRVERRRAVRRHQVERRGVEDRRPPLRLGRLPGQRRDPAGEHGERGILLDGGIAERGDPALHGGHLAGLVGRQNQRRQQLDAPIALGRVEQVLESHRRGTVGLVPVRGPQVQLHDDVGLDPAQLAEQELPEQTVVAVPLAPAVERDQEDVRGLQVAQLLLRTRLGEEGIAERSTELVEHRGVPQEPLRLLGDLGQRFAVQVVGHVAILTRDRERLPVALARDRRRQVKADRPALGPLRHRSSHVAGEADLGPEKICSAPADVEGQVAGHELQRVARAPQPGQMGLLGPARRHQLGAWGIPEITMLRTS